MKRRPALILGMALVCGGLAWYLASGYLRTPAAAAPAPPSETSRVVVAARDLPGGAMLSAADLRTIDWPAAEVPAGYLRTTAGVVGRGLAAPMKANEPVLESKLAGSGMGGLTSVIPPGMRGVSVKVDEVTAVSGFVLPGTRVDVLVTLSPMGDRPGATRLVLQNITVLAAGQSYQPNTEGTPQDASVITLLVTPAEAELLTLASNEGRIQLALRNTLDQAVASTRGAVSSSLGGGPMAAPPPAPARPPTGPAPAAITTRSNGAAVEIYHGSARTVTSF